jgi:mono/diheme cytochrome c family protein
MRFFLSLLILSTLSACQNEADRASSKAAPSDEETVRYAQAHYDPAMFDTVQWVDDSAHLARGEDVFRWACAKCHGITGKGDGGEVIAGDTVHPPSFLQSDWRFADDENGLRRRIFVGNARGMPHWGLRGMQPGDIVAVEKYILMRLRPQQVTQAQ